MKIPGHFSAQIYRTGTVHRMAVECQRGLGLRCRAMEARRDERRGSEFVHFRHLTGQLPPYRLPVLLRCSMAQIVPPAHTVHDDRGQFRDETSEVRHLDSAFFAQPMDRVLALERNA